MKMKKVLAIGLSAAMIMTVVPGNVFAAELEQETVEIEDFSDDVEIENSDELGNQEFVEEEPEKETPEIEIQDDEAGQEKDLEQEINDGDIALFSDGEESVARVGDGEVSSNIQWKIEDLDEDGLEDTLTISGEGDMPDYTSYEEEPWYAYRKTIRHLIIGDEITSIGSYTFMCNNLQSIEWGSGITRIGDFTLSGCSTMQKLELPKNLISIGRYSFTFWTSLTELEMPNSLKILGDSTFSDCHNLTSVKFSENIEEIGRYAFGSCTKVKNIFLPTTIKKIGDQFFRGKKFYKNSSNLYYGCCLSYIHYAGTKADMEKIDGIDQSEDSPSGNRYLRSYFHYSVYHAPKEATCLKKGFVGYWICNTCGGKIYADAECTQELSEIPIIPALGHDLDQGNISKEANCTEEGVVTYSCQREGCDYTETKSIPTNGKHIYGEPSYTWNEDNTECIATEICSLCQYEDTESVKAQETTLTPATCSQEGKVHYTALFTNDNFVTQDKEVIVPQLSHKNTEIRNARNATCESSGYSGDVYCKDCGKFLSEGSIIKAKGHLWDDGTVKKEPTCVEKGEKVYTCFRCDETRSEKLEAVGHKWNDKETTDLKATCTTSGRKSIHCSVCDEIQDGSQQIIPALGHNWSEGVIEKKATCTEKGMQIVTCLRCGKEKEEEIPAVGHAVVRDEKIPATCETDGKTEGNHCSVCGKILTEQKIIPATGHKEVKDTAVAATCEKDGLTEGSHCSVCGKVLAAQNVVKAIGHSWDEGKITKEATCEENGVKTYTCANCKATKTEDIKALGHKEVKDAAVTATCEKDGLTEGSHCSVCNKVLTEQQKVPATGHKFSSWETTSQATVFSPMKQSRSCSVCGKSEQRQVGSKLQKKMTVSATTLPLKKKQKTTVLKVTGLAKGDSIVSWKSSNTKIAKVVGRTNGTSVITAGTKTGKAKITITLKSGLQKAVTVSVQKNAVKTTRISGVVKTLRLKRKQKAVLRPVIAPLTSTEKVTYKSSNTKVATVNSKGQITAKKKGTAVITVKSGGKTVKCKVTVK